MSVRRVSILTIRAVDVYSLLFKNLFNINSAIFHAVFHVIYLKSDQETLSFTVFLKTDDNCMVERIAHLYNETFLEFY